MADLTAQRTLVKSPPELWSELSEVESLAKHLGELGEIRIVKVEPESTVAWEGEEVSGTVELEQSGWGTKVTFRATVPEPGPAVEPEAATESELASEAADPEPIPEPVAIQPEPVEPEPEPAVVIEPVAEIAQTEPSSEPKQGFIARWLFRRRQPPLVAPLEPPAPEPVAVEPEPEPEAAEPPAIESAPEREPEPVAVAVESEAAEPPAIESAPEREPEPVAVESEAAEPPAIESAPEREPEPVAVESDPPAEPEPATVATTDTERVQRVLDGTLEALGQAHHRPFSRG